MLLKSRGAAFHVVGAARVLNSKESFLPLRCSSAVERRAVRSVRIADSFVGEKGEAQSCPALPLTLRRGLRSPHGAFPHRPSGGAVPITMGCRGAVMEFRSPARCSAAAGRTSRHPWGEELGTRWARSWCSSRLFPDATVALTNSTATSRGGTALNSYLLLSIIPNV